jgi:hypothetical protein
MGLLEPTSQSLNCSRQDICVRKWTISQRATLARELQLLINDIELKGKLSFLILEGQMLDWILSLPPGVPLDEAV